MNGKRSAADRIANATALASAVALGISAGAMFTEAAFFAPWWRALPVSEFLDWFAANAQRLTDFYGPLEVAAALLAIAAAALARARRQPGSGWLIAAAALAVAVLLLFPLYFQSANASFATGAIAEGDVAAALARWSAWQWLRTAIGVAAHVAALLGWKRQD